MRIIILSAGKGDRLMPLTADRPKSLIDLGGGQTLLYRQLTAIAETKITQVTIVCGYLADQLQEKAEEYGKSLGLDLKFQYNPFYWCSNNLVSLWFAKSWIDTGDGVVIVNGDDLFRPRVLSSLLEVGSDREIVVVVSRKHRYDREDMKVLVEGESIRLISKRIPRERADAESIGMIRVVGKRSLNLVAGQLETMVRQDRCRDLFWLECFNELIDQGTQVGYHEVDDRDWVEMDVHPDLEMITERIRVSTFDLGDD